MSHSAICRFCRKEDFISNLGFVPKLNELHCDRHIRKHGHIWQHRACYLRHYGFVDCPLCGDGTAMKAEAEMWERLA